MNNISHTLMSAIVIDKFSVTNIDDTVSYHTIIINNITEVDIMSVKKVFKHKLLI